MKLVTYIHEGKERTGIVSEDEKMIYETSFESMNDIILSGEKPKPKGDAVPIDDVTLRAPIPRPLQDVICLGINYAAHAEESAR